jgi:glycosyltransferase involved in cell wall biosynthesis
MLSVGITPLDIDGYWVGGRYYLHHLIRCVAALGEVALRDVHWEVLPARDPFEEVRAHIGPPLVARFPANATGRALRFARRAVRRIRDARDLLPGIDVTFPLPVLEHQGVPYVFWLSDFQHEHLRHLYREEAYASIVRMFAQRASAASRIVVSSEFGRTDLARFLPELLGRTDVLRFCSVPEPEWFSVEPAAYCASTGLPPRFFVIANQFTEHKNHLVAIEAVRLLRDRGVAVHIVCTGSDYDFRGLDYFGRVREYVTAHGLASQIHFLGLLPRPQQMAVMRNALAIAQPSRFEGWSTVIEDAKSLGKPVIASDFPVHHEQLGSQAIFCNVDDAEAWARAFASADELLASGVDANAEEVARRRLEIAMRETGETFVSVMRRAAGQA